MRFRRTESVPPSALTIVYPAAWLKHCHRLQVDRFAIALAGNRGALTCWHARNDHCRDTAIAHSPSRLETHLSLSALCFRRGFSSADKPQQVSLSPKEAIIVDGFSKTPRYVLKALNLAEKTLVVFTSDNGAAVGSSLPLRAKKGSVYDGGIREPTLMWWPGKIPTASVCREVAASIDLMPTLAELCGGKVPTRKIDGKNIWPLMNGVKNAVSPHENYVLMHGPGTVRSGKWKFYPWPEGKGTPKRDTASSKPSKFPVQLYDTVADISEKTNLAALNPDIVNRLQAAYDQHVAEIKANQRPTASMIRPDDALLSDRPGAAKKSRAKKRKQSK